MTKRHVRNIVVPLLIGGMAFAVLFPVFAQPKRYDPREKVRMAGVRKLRLRMQRQQVLGTLKSGKYNMREVEDTVTRLWPDDPLRYEFAKCLDQRGQTALAFRVERTRAHALGYEIPRDEEMKLLADLAQRSGDRAEAAWAKARTGPEGRYRLFRQGPIESLIAQRTWLEKSGRFETEVNLYIEQGIKGVPERRTQLENLRHRLLAST